MSEIVEFYAMGRYKFNIINILEAMFDVSSARMFIVFIELSIRNFVFIDKEVIFDLTIELIDEPTGIFINFFYRIPENKTLLCTFIDRCIHFRIGLC